MDQHGSAQIRTALLTLQERCCAAELPEVLDATSIAVLQDGCVSAIALLDAEGMGPSTIDAICRVAGRCIALIGEAEGLVAVAAHIVRQALVTLATLLPPRRSAREDAELGVHFTVELAATRALELLEEISDELDFIVISIFGSLFRAQRAKEEEGSCIREPTSSQEMAHLQALQGVAVWTLTVLARAVGYDRMNGKILWEWASGDPFCILVLTRALLAFGLHSAHARDIWLEAGFSASMMPEDIKDLQDVILNAVLEAASPDIVFQANSSEFSNNIGIAERNETLSLHRALLAVAVADCGFTDILIARLADCLTSSLADALHLGGSVVQGPPKALAIVAFFAALVPPPVDSLPTSLREFTDAFAVQLAHRSDQLWPLLANAVDAVPMASPLRGAYARSLLKDCAAIAYAAPPEAASCWDFHRRCLSEQSSQLAAEVRVSPKALAALVVLSANASFPPGGDHPAGTILTGIDDSKRAEVVTRLALWQGPLRAEHLTPWVSLMGTIEQAPVPDEEDDFFELSRREARAAAAAAGPPPPGPPPPPPAPVGTGGPPAERPPPSPDKLGLRDLMCRVPPELACSIDGRLVVDPVRSPFGQVFERSVLERALLASGGICPITRCPLTLEQCPRDQELRKQALAWVRVNRAKKPQ